MVASICIDGIDDMTKVIKKYKNRRLYDTDLSQYVTLEDLKNYILMGESFLVVEAGSDKEITNNILLQILVEQGSDTNQFLSTPILKHLIVLADKPMNHAFQNMLEQMLNNMQGNEFLHEMKKSNEELTQQAEKAFNQWLAMFKR